MERICWRLVQESVEPLKGTSVKRKEQLLNRGPLKLGDFATISRFGSTQLSIAKVFFFFFFFFFFFPDIGRLRSYSVAVFTEYF